MAGERFRINGKTYRVDLLDEISLKQMLLFDEQAEDMGLRARWADVEIAVQELEGGTPADFARHPRRNLLTSATVWAAQVLAGDQVTLDEAVGMPFKKIEWIEAPKDRRPPAKKKSASAKASRSVRPVPSSVESPQEQPSTPSSETSELKSDIA